MKLRYIRGHNRHTLAKLMFRILVAMLGNMAGGVVRLFYGPSPLSE